MVWESGCILRPTIRESFCGRRLAGAAERAGRTKARVVKEDDQHVGRALWRAQRGVWEEKAVSGSLAS